MSLAMFSVCLGKWEKENLSLRNICLCAKDEAFHGTRERLRFLKGGYSLSLKFNLANEFSSSFVIKRKLTTL
uniref:Putative ovule protein n=1 Tax=Solanum chacoense TaxID=4108 RepID=A0A0V0H1M7_SOLCH